MKDKHIIAKCKTIEKYLFLNLKKFIIDNIFYKMRLNKKSGMKKCRETLNVGINKVIKKKGVSYEEKKYYNFINCIGYININFTICL